ncbi:MAG: hypothetical protein IPP81_21260 [Chitinophagaceae bacterium]|nr:hypothetical protein [Chitinophagaceae bacterium]
MTTFYKISLLLFLLIEVTNLFAQDKFEIETQRNIDSLLKSNVDTVISLSNSIAYVPQYSENGDTALLRTMTLLYFSKEKWHGMKFLHVFIGQGATEKILKSVAVDLGSDSLLKYLKTLIPKISNDQFLSYIYQVESTNSVGYDILTSSHQTYCYLSIDAKDYQLNKSFDLEDICERTKFIEAFPKNMNFEYNKHLSLYPFYLTMVEILNRIDIKFKFR